MPLSKARELLYPTPIDSREVLHQGKENRYYAFRPKVPSHFLVVVIGAKPSTLIRCAGSRIWHSANVLAEFPNFGNFGGVQPRSPYLHYTSVRNHRRSCRLSTLAAERQDPDFLIGAPVQRKTTKKRSAVKILHSPFQITIWHF
jgi:hypothetical protein